MKKPPMPKAPAPDLILPGTVIRTGGKTRLLPPWNVTLDAKIYNDANRGAAARRQAEIDAAGKPKRPTVKGAADERDNRITALRASAPKAPPGRFARFIGKLFGGKGA